MLVYSYLMGMAHQDNRQNEGQSLFIWTLITFSSCRLHSYCFPSKCRVTHKHCMHICISGIRTAGWRAHLVCANPFLLWCR